MYIFGGRDAASQALDELWILDFATVTWTQVARFGEWPNAREYVR